MGQFSNSMDFARLDGKTAVVTGSSSGVGRAIAMEFAAAGADVLVHTRANRSGAAEVAASIQSIGRRAHVAVADLCESQDVERLVREAWDWAGGVDIWVNNAGADVLTGPAAGWSFEDKLQCLWRVDVSGTIELARRVGRRMLANAKSGGHHSILNIGWDQVEHGMAGDSGEMFSAAKGAVTAFTKSLARSLAPAVRVNCIAPGWIRTAWASDAPEYWQERAERESLLARWGTPEDVAKVARFLVSPAAGFVTGQIVAVNGGFRGEAR